MAEKRGKIIIIDGNALVHRAFHALPPLSTKKGQLVNAVYGFFLIFLKVIKELRPAYAAVTFDKGRVTFRHKIYKEYKAQRKKQPQELYDQIPIVQEILRAFGLPILAQTNFEADDLIGALCERFKEENKVIVTGDLDTLQLVDDKTKVYTLKKGVKETAFYDERAIKERFGLNPRQLIDFKALRGDESDNIPGLPGVGEKTATELLQKYGTISNIYKNLDKLPAKLQEKFKKDRKILDLSRQLVTIVKKAPLKISLKDCEFGHYDRQKIVELLQNYEFKSLLAQLVNLPDWQGQISLFKSAAKNQYELIDTEEKFKNFFTIFKKQKIFALDTETDQLNPFQAKLYGISFSWQKDIAYFVLPQWLKELKEILTDAEIKKVGHNLKFDLEVLQTAEVELKGLYFDTMIASYLLNPGSRQHNLERLVFAEFGQEMKTYQENMSIEELSDYSCADADFTWRLYEKFTEELKKKNLFKLFQEIEMPLVSVLAGMERNGAKIDVKVLERMSREYELRIKNLEFRIYKLAGKKFNVASPMQLKEILFEKLKISKEDLRKTKTGFSTAASELEKMRDQHPIIPLIEEFRELSKLKTTYLDTLPERVDCRGRVHTSFNQTITATGRLSSSEPNLQNVPPSIRVAFIAEKGYKILAADYSQIELRIIASLAHDEKMLQAFQRQEDIHVRTAAEIHDLKPTEVTPELRQKSKTINFGIIYGMGVHGLAEAAKISHQEAQEFMAKYFSLHQGIKEYIETTKALAHQLGYVETLFGRRRYLPEINSTVLAVKVAAERMAINMPIQGTAADLIKMAMIKIYREVKEAKMILQVHDELVFEIKENELREVAKKIREIMENIYKLKAPIEVHLEFGDNWGNLKKLE